MCEYIKKAKSDCKNKFGMNRFETYSEQVKNRFETVFLDQIRRDQISDQIAQWGLGKGLKVPWDQIRD